MLIFMKKLIGLGLILLSAYASAQSADPYAANNGFYPGIDSNGKQLWTGSYRTSNYNFPQHSPNLWKKMTPNNGRPLTKETAPAYVEALKKFVEPSMRGMIEQPSDWNTTKVGWYDMPWQASAGNAENGREAILGSFTGQILPAKTFKGLDMPLQNYTVIYYDALSATMLKKLWANPFNPNRKAVNFPEGAMVIKAAAVSPTLEQWPVLEGSAQWQIWRPTVSQVQAGDLTPKAPLPVRVMQFDIIVKDSKASPQTGWVFTTFVHNKDAPGNTPWDKLVPLGAMWGNDPQVTTNDSTGKDLKETWINYAGSAPYAIEQLGWGGRLSGPIDVSKRHAVVFTDGSRAGPTQRVSSCLSCHSSAQFPFVANLYPSPNRSFPKDGETFLMYPPGSQEWSRWFQNRPGNVPMSPNVGAVALDYDMLIMFALDAFDAANGGDRYVQRNLRTQFKTH
jgi:hypothetical protein